MDLCFVETAQTMTVIIVLGLRMISVKTLIKNSGRLSMKEMACISCLTSNGEDLCFVGTAQTMLVIIMFGFLANVVTIAMVRNFGELFKSMSELSISMLPAEMATFNEVSSENTVLMFVSKSLHTTCPCFLLP